MAGQMALQIKKPRDCLRTFRDFFEQIPEVAPRDLNKMDAFIRQIGDNSVNGALAIRLSPWDNLQRNVSIAIDFLRYVLGKNGLSLKIHFKVNDLKIINVNPHQRAQEGRWGITYLNLHSYCFQPEKYIIPANIIDEHCAEILAADWIFWLLSMYPGILSCYDVLVPGIEIQSKPGHMMRIHTVDNIVHIDLHDINIPICNVVIPVLITF